MFDDDPDISSLPSFDTVANPKRKAPPAVSRLTDFTQANGFTVTSTTGGKHNQGSKHYSGQAVDVRTRDKSPEDVTAMMERAAQAGYRVLDERQRPPGQKEWDKPHLHLEDTPESRTLASLPSFDTVAEKPKPAPKPNNDLLNRVTGPNAGQKIISDATRPGLVQGPEVTPSGLARSRNLDRMSKPIDLGKNPKQQTFDIGTTESRRAEYEAANKPLPPAIPRQRGAGVAPFISTALRGAASTIIPSAGVSLTPDIADATSLIDRTPLAAANTLRAGVNTALAMPEGAATFADQAARSGLKKVAPDFYDFVRDKPGAITTTVRGVTTPIKDSVSDTFTGRPASSFKVGNLPVGRFLEEVVPQALGSQVAFAIGQAVTRGGALSSAILGALVGAAQGYDDAKAAGADEETALRSGALNGFVGTSEAMGLGHAFEGITKGRALREMASNIGEEMVQEAGQQGAQNKIANQVLGYDPGRSSWEGVPESALAAMFTAGGTEAGGLAARRLAGAGQNQGQPPSGDRQPVDFRNGTEIVPIDVAKAAAQDIQSRQAPQPPTVVAVQTRQSPQSAGAVNVQGSGNVARVGYDPATQTMRVRFTNGADYDYSNVPPDVYAAMEATANDPKVSTGDFLNKNIKGKYDYQKVNAQPATPATPTEPQSLGSIAERLAARKSVTTPATPPATTQAPPAPAQAAPVQAAALTVPDAPAPAPVSSIEILGPDASLDVPEGYRLREFTIDGQEITVRTPKKMDKETARILAKRQLRQGGQNATAQIPAQSPELPFEPNPVPAPALEGPQPTSAPVPEAPTVETPKSASLSEVTPPEIPASEIAQPLSPKAKPEKVKSPEDVRADLQRIYKVEDHPAFNDIARREVARREIKDTGKFHALAIQGFPDAAGEKMLALSEHPEVRAMLGLPEMPAYHLEDGKVDPAWHAAGQHTLDALAEAAGITRSSEAHGKDTLAMQRYLQGQGASESVMQSFHATRLATNRYFQNVRAVFEHPTVDTHLDAIAKAMDEGRPVDKATTAKLIKAVRSVAKEINQNAGPGEHIADTAINGLSADLNKGRFEGASAGPLVRSLGAIRRSRGQANQGAQPAPRQSEGTQGTGTPETPAEVAAVEVEKPKPVVQPEPTFTSNGKAAKDVEGDNRNLLTEIRRAGGMAHSDQMGGELRRISQKETGTTGLLNRNSNIKPDVMREMMKSEGLTHAETVAEFLDEIEGHLKDKREKGDDYKTSLDQQYEDYRNSQMTPAERADADALESAIDNNPTFAGLFEKVSHYEQEPLPEEVRQFREEAERSGISPDGVERFLAEWQSFRNPNSMDANAESQVSRTDDQISEAPEPAVKPVEAAKPVADLPEPDWVSEKPAKEAKPTSRSSRSTNPDIQDFGEKIGGARKDTAVPLGPKRKTAAEEDTRPAWERKYSIGEIASGTDKGKFSVHRDDGSTGATRSWRGYNDPKFNTRAEAEAAIPLLEVSRKHKVGTDRVEGQPDSYYIYRKVADGKYPRIKGGFATQEAAKQYISDHATEIIEHKFPDVDKARPWLDRITREGTPRREGDVSTKQFQDDFGFRGGEFGNWNMGGDGQQALNHAYEGLHDLAETLGIAPRALSLNGELAIAFGARGHGLQGARAHYEPVKAVINLTKIHGAGALSHEWFHALDHFVGRMEKGIESYATDKDGRFATEGFSRNTKAEQALVDAWKNIVNTITAKHLDVPIEYADAARSAAQQSENVNEHLARLKQEFLRDESTYNKRWKPATTEQKARWDALAAKIAAGDVGKSQFIKGKAAFKGRSSFDAIEELNSLYKEVKGRAFYTSADNSSGYGLYWRVLSMKKMLARVESAEAGMSENKKIPTDYFKEAKKADESRVSDYYSTVEEMGARAFEAYIFDKLKAQGKRSDYLVHGVENKYYKALDLKPYPEGAERVAINNTFDALFENPQLMFGVAAERAEPKITAGLRDINRTQEGHAQIISDLADWLAPRIINTAHTIQRVTIDAIKKFGTKVKPFIKEAYSRAQAFFSSELGSAKASPGGPSIDESVPKKASVPRPTYSIPENVDLEKLFTTASAVIKESNIPASQQKQAEAHFHKLIDAADANDGAAFVKAQLALKKSLTRNYWGAADLARPINAGGELSVIGRQGYLGWVSHPILSYSALMDVKMTEEGLYDYLAKMRSDPDYDLIRKTKADIGLFNELDLTKDALSREENTSGNWVDAHSHRSGLKTLGTSKIAKGLMNLERINKTFIDGQRFQLMKHGLEIIRNDPRGKVFNEDGSISNQLNQYAQRVNVVTGRANLGDSRRAAAAADLMSTVFYSPRFSVSRFQALAPYEAVKAMELKWNRKDFIQSFKNRPRISNELWKDYAKQNVGQIAAATLIATVITQTLGGSVSFDPDDPDFGKLVIGNQHIPLIQGGILPAARFGFRMVRRGYEISSAAGRGKGDDAGRAAKTTAGQIGSFLRQKEAPLTGWLHDQTLARRDITDAVTGERVNMGTNAIYQPVTAGKDLVMRFLPMTYMQAIDTYREAGAGVAAGSAAGEFLGLTTGTYDSGKYGDDIAAGSKNKAQLRPEYSYAKENWYDPKSGIEPDSKFRQRISRANTIYSEYLPKLKASPMYKDASPEIKAKAEDSLRRKVNDMSFDEMPITGKLAPGVIFGGIETGERRSEANRRKQARKGW